MSSSRTEGASAGSATVAPGEATTTVDVIMPQMGVSVAEGTVVAWRVEVGDRIEVEQTICEISTDKIDTEVPAPASGTVTEILVPVETTVSVGQVLARVSTGGRAAEPTSRPLTDAPLTQPEPPAPPESPTEPEPQAQPETPAPPEPQAPPESPTEPEPQAPPESPRGPEPAVQAPSLDAPETGGSAADANGAPPPGAPSDQRRYSPVVQRIAAEHGIDLSRVPGTGRGGRVRKQDVLAFVESGGAGVEPSLAESSLAESSLAESAPAVAEPPLHIESPYRPEPVGEAAQGDVAAAAGGLSRMRRQIGEHMKRSLQTAAHCTTWIEADMSRIELARARLGFTALPFVARATIAALREHPALNATLEDERYTRHERINLGIAVSLGDDGLIVPVIHDSHELSVEGLAARIRDLARRARSRQLDPDEVRGGTFTITNPGQYGSIMATPIINQPQVAILDLEAVNKHPVVVADAEGNDAIAIRPTTILGLSWDHRALDGAQAAQFLASVKRHLEGWTGA